MNNHTNNPKEKSGYRKIDNYIDQFGLYQEGISDQNFFDNLTRHHQSILSQVLNDLSTPAIHDIKIKTKEDLIKTLKLLGKSFKDFEIFQIVDENGNPLRYQNGRPVLDRRYNCHSKEKKQENIHPTTEWLVRNTDGEYLFSTRGSIKFVDLYPGALETGGGHPNLGEQPLDSVKREIHEELGIQPDNIIIKETMKYLNKNQEQTEFSTFFEITIKNKNDIKIDQKEISKYKWYTREEIIEYLKKFLPKLKTIEKISDIAEEDKAIVPRQILTLIKSMQTDEYDPKLEYLEKETYIQLERLGIQIIEK